MPAVRHAASLANAIGAPSAKEKMKRFGLINTELIINETRRCCGTPFRPSDAISGTVPYMHIGDAAPSKAAGMTARMPRLPDPCLPASAVILGDRNTDIREPVIVPATQYGKIILN